MSPSPAASQEHKSRIGKAGGPKRQVPMSCVRLLPTGFPQRVMGKEEREVEGQKGLGVGGRSLH